MPRNFELLQALGREHELMPEATAVEQPHFKTFNSEPEALPVVQPHPTLKGVELEEITRLVQQTFLVKGNGGPHTVVFTATESGNGCSWIAANVAEVLASHVSGPVCLVDANFRNPSLHERFKLVNTRGLADALRVNEPIRSFAHSVTPANLFVMTSGSEPEKAASFLASDRTRNRLAELRSWANFVLVDASALGVALDATVLGAASDGVVLVLKANESRREPARRAVADLTAAKAKVLGAVLNYRTYPVPDVIYSRL
jgi:capsular exopolysaccharide synthesis family protein